MVPTAEQISGAWRSRILRPQTSQYVGLLIFSTFFDDNSGAGSTQNYFELQLCSPQGLLDMVAGPGGRRLMFPLLI